MSSAEVRKASEFSGEGFDGGQGVFEELIPVGELGEAGSLEGVAGAPVC